MVVACIVFSMFFCTLSLQPDHRLYPSNFLMARLYIHDDDADKQIVRIEKIKCILSYIA